MMTSTDLASRTTVIPPNEPDLPTLAKIINTKHKAVLDNLRNAVKKAMDCGDALIKAKAALQHGEFTPWLRDNCDVMPRTVQERVFLARHRRQVEPWLRENPNGSIAGALKLIRQSPDAKPEATISEDAVVSEIVKKVQGVLGKDHQRGLVVAARVVERLKDMRLVD
jgi:hypothetical protein